MMDHRRTLWEQDLLSRFMSANLVSTGHFRDSLPMVTYTGTLPQKHAPWTLPRVSLQTLCRDAVAGTWDIVCSANCPVRVSDKCDTIDHLQQSQEKYNHEQ
jgi:hypothetical protein